MKLIIQIPSYNEAGILPRTLAALPRVVAGFDEVEWLVIDDGSSDGTAACARSLGVDHVIRHSQNQGLARAFMSGLNAALALGADVIVNTDADNQYNADDIPALVAPILRGQADLVIGVREISKIPHFPPLKKFLQTVGSFVVGLASGTRIADAPSGFRAIRRSAAQRLMVFGSHTYTLETLIQAGRSDIAIASVPIRVNNATRPSRLFRSQWSYVARGSLSILRSFVIYRPLRFFGILGLSLVVGSCAVGLYPLYQLFRGMAYPSIPALILAAGLGVMGLQTILLAFVADLISANRRLIEELRSKTGPLTTPSHCATEGLCQNDPTMGAYQQSLASYTNITPPSP